MNNKFIYAVLFSSILVALSGCDDKKAEPKPAHVAAKAADTAEKSSTAAAPKASAAEVAAKLQIYIKCYSLLDAGINHSFNQYSSWVKDVDQGPAGNETEVSGMSPVNSKLLEFCNNKMPLAAERQPGIPELDRAALNFIKSANSLSEVMNSLSQYYQQEDYKKDAFLKGKTSHAEFMNKLKSYNSDSVAFRSAIDTANDAQQLARLQEIEQSEGKNVRYHALSIVINAKKLNAILVQDKFSAESATRIVSEIQASLDVMKQPSANTAKKPQDYSKLIKNIEEYVLAAQQRINHVRDNQPFTEAEKAQLTDQKSSAMVEGTFNHAMKANNEMVASFNLLQ